MSALAFIAARIVCEDRGYTSDCWIWTGYKNEKGYGRSYVPGLGNNKRIHRVTYELLIGAIPDGLVLDHLCKVKACCNPQHLEPVTDWENRRRAGQVGEEGKCLRGHDATHRNRSGNCRICQSERVRRPRDRQKHADYMREWTARNRDRVNEERRLRRLANRDAINATRRAARAAQKIST